MKTPEAYKRSYDLFTTQAQEILEISLAGTTQSAEAGNYYLRTDDKNLSDKILENVMKFSRSDVINEIEIDLRGGAALVDIITRLQDNEEYRDLPG